jgi:hypothetical protein
MTIIFLPVLLIGLVFYFLPTILAYSMHRPNVLLIFLINILLGWTVLGWIAALVLVFIDTGTIPTINASALEIARRRYAKGEITKAEFEEIKKTL